MGLWLQCLEYFPQEGRDYHSANHEFQDRHGPIRRAAAYSFQPDKEQWESAEDVLQFGEQPGRLQPSIL